MSNEATSTDDSSQEQRLDRLEREMIHEESLEMAAFRRLLHGLSDESIDSDPIAKVDAIIERIRNCTLTNWIISMLSLRGR